MKKMMMMVVANAVCECRRTRTSGRPSPHSSCLECAYVGGVYSRNYPIPSYHILSYTGGQTDNAKFITCNAAKAQPACSDISMGWIRYGEEVEEEEVECWVWRADHLSILLNFSLFTHNRK